MTVGTAPVGVGGAATAQHESAQGDALYASISLSQLSGGALFTLQGTLTDWRAAPFKGTDGTTQYAHNISLHHAASRKFLKCTFWHDMVVDLRPLLGQQVAFHVSYLKAAREEKYGTVLGRDIPAVVFNGNVDQELVKQYENPTL